jgi:hypothetical protein
MHVLSSGRQSLDRLLPNLAQCDILKLRFQQWFQLLNSPRRFRTFGDLPAATMTGTFLLMFRYDPLRI